MHVIHHGAHEGVTGSCHQLFLTDKRSLLIDCGQFQGQDAKDHDETQIEFPLDGIQALILTHVHLDHIGRVPYLLAAGYNGPIFCTPPTAKLLPLMLEDALRLGVTRNKRLIARFLQELKRLVRPVGFGKWYKMDGGTQFRFQPAGHVLGSAYVEVEHGDERFVFSGDLGSRNAPLLNEPKSPEKADFLVLESTYGDRLHEGREDRCARLESILCNTMAKQWCDDHPRVQFGTHARTAVRTERDLPSRRAQVRLRFVEHRGRDRRFAAFVAADSDLRFDARVLERRSQASADLR